MPRFVSWLEKAIDELPQAKATAQQWMAQLKKSPLANMNEIEDRGLDEFLGGQYDRSGGRAIAKEDIQGWLSEQPMPMPQRLGAGNDYDEYATPGLAQYRNYVEAEPMWDPRDPSDHFSGYPGYRQHTRGGMLENTNVGRTQVLDEVQSDLKGNIRDRWDPEGMTQSEAALYTPEGARTGPWRRVNPYLGYDSTPIEEMTYMPGSMSDDLGQAQYEIEQLRQEIPQGGDLDWGLQELASYNQDVATRGRANMPGKDRMEWQAMANYLNDAVEGDMGALAWPSSDVQYRRYFKRSPEHYQSVLDTAAADAKLFEGNSFGREGVRREQAEAKQALGSLQMYKNQYDKRMPRDKRWKQLGLEPKLVDLSNTRPKGWSPSSPGDGSRALGKYWVVQLTPETKARLKESGIPYYVMGGAAVLGQEDDGALD